MFVLCCYKDIRTGVISPSCSAEADQIFCVARPHYDFVDCILLECTTCDVD